MGLHEVDRHVVALGVVIVGVLRVNDLENLILGIVGDIFLHVLDVGGVVRRGRRRRDERHLAAVRRIHERAVEHGLRRLLVGHLIDEHVARILGGVRVEGRHDE